MKRLFGQTVDVTGGPLISSILKYSIPVVIGSLIQVLFNAADIAVLGNMADGVAVASVGVTASIVGLIVNSFVGLSSGCTIMLARFIGMRDERQARATVGTSMVSSFFIGLILTVVGIALVDPMLGVIECPDKCWDGAALYLRIYFMAIPVIMVYNFGAAILRVNGDTTSPLLYLVFSGLLNIVLNVVLCLLLTEKVAAVAIATFASQVLGAVLVVFRLTRTEGDCHLDLRHLSFSPSILGRVLRLGFPVALNASLYSLANLQIQAAINSFGTGAVAGNTTCTNVEGVLNSVTGALGAATVAFVGQNIGAGNRDRVKKSILTCAMLGVVSCLVMGYGILFFGKDILAIFTPGDAEAIHFGYIRMQFLMSMYFIPAISSVLNSSTQAFGYTFLPMITSLITVLGFRVVWMAWIYPHFLIIESLYFCFVCSWILTMLVNAVMFGIVYTRYRRGRTRAV
ncbi:MAG: MATE family efflux transporter [Clostridia bacterium]|nr:MATE family efflux transporter [Clostridia bacterium]